MQAGPPSVRPAAAAPHSQKPRESTKAAKVLNFYDQPQQQSETEMLSKSLEQEPGEGTEVIFQGTIPKKSGSGSSAGGAASNNSSAPAQ